LRNDLTEARLSEDGQEEEDAGVEVDAPEPPELEDVGDSSAMLEDGPPGAIFEIGWSGDLPLMRQLPRRLRPQVRYQIDDDLVVHTLHRKISRSTELERNVAVALAEHLRRVGTRCEEAGDWCRIPAIGSDEVLVELMKDACPKTFEAAVFHSVGNVLKNFAIELPNGDVVTPQALVEPARRGKLTTRAAALRLAGRRPQYLPCGEEWTADDWDGFESTQKRGKRRGLKAVDAT
jgi:hypothetical protein